MAFASFNFPVLSPRLQPSVSVQQMANSDLQFHAPKKKNEPETTKKTPAAIRAAEARAAGRNVTQLRGLGATAQAAATFNARVADDYNKITISDVLSDATGELAHDKAVTREDADRVRGAELSSKSDMMATPGGVADTMATAARANRDDTP